MSVLVLVRHGQASFGHQDYDKLSELGWKQSRMLGAWEASSGFSIDGVFCGPLTRHVQTDQGFREGHQGQLPSTRQLDGLSEHGLLALMNEHRTTVMEQSARVRALVAEPTDDPPRLLRKLLVTVAEEWVAGRIDVPQVETWRAFRRRVDETLDLMLDPEARSRRFVAFTSGGFMGATVGSLLRLDEHATFTMAAALRNTASVEIRFSGTRRSLLSFNHLPHLNDPTLITDV